jgi:hypothetical protein
VFLGILTKIRNHKYEKLERLVILFTSFFQLGILKARTSTKFVGSALLHQLEGLQKFCSTPPSPLQTLTLHLLLLGAISTTKRLLASRTWEIEVEADMIVNPTTATRKRRVSRSVELLGDVRFVENFVHTLFLMT